jgi:hypothetical protein
MEFLAECKATEISQQPCKCPACLFRPTPDPAGEQSDLSRPNCLHTLLELLPSNFPLTLEQTVVVREGEERAPEFHCYSNQAREDKQVALTL